MNRYATLSIFVIVGLSIIGLIACIPTDDPDGILYSYPYLQLPSARVYDFTTDAGAYCVFVDGGVRNGELSCDFSGVTE